MYYFLVKSLNIKSSRDTLKTSLSLINISIDMPVVPLSKELICPNMKTTTLVDLYNTMIGEGGEEIIMDEQTIKDAKKCIDMMIKLGE